MSFPVQQGSSNDSGAGEAEQTLRLIARLPAPEGLEDRVQAGLRAAPRAAKVLAWPGAVTPAGGWLRAAAAAAIVFVVAGGGWGIYSRVGPGEPAHGVAGPRLAAPGSFTEGGAVHRPQTLVGPVVTPAVTHSMPPATSKPKPPAKSAAAIAADTMSKAQNKAAAVPAAPTVQ